MLVSQLRHALCRVPMTRPIRFDSSSRQQGRCVLDLAQIPPAACEQVILFGRFIGPDSNAPLWMRRIAVILMDRQHGGGSIDNAGSRAKRLPDCPVIPARPPNDEIWNFFIEQSPAEQEIINPPFVSLLICHDGHGPDFLLPSRIRKIKRLSDVRIPTPANHEYVLGRLANASEGLREIKRQDDVAVGVAKRFMGGDLMSSIKHGIHVGKTGGIPRDFGFVAKTEFAADLARALVVAKQNDFNIRVQKLPAFQCIALDDRGMSAEGLGRSEECDHRE
jgi:hypothetical protein